MYSNSEADQQVQSITNMHYFYVLRCQDQSLYAGYTTDLSRRLQQHNQGCGAKYTRPASRRPLRLIHAEGFADKRQAMQAEYAFKQLSKVQKLAYLAKHKSIPLPAA